MNGSKYFKYANFNPWNQFISDCAVRAIAGATYMSYVDVCRTLGVKWKTGRGLVRDTGIGLDDIKAKFGEYFDQVEDFFDDQQFVPDEFRDTYQAKFADDIDAELGVENRSGVTLAEFMDLYSGQGVFLVGLVGNPDAYKKSARDGGHIVAVYLNPGKKHLFLDTWDSHEMYVDAYMRVAKQIQPGDPRRCARYFASPPKRIPNKEPAKLKEASGALGRKIGSFRQKLKDGIVDFSYRKVDGTTRKASGTLNPELMPDRAKSYRKKTKRGMPKDSVAYWDLGKDALRSFKDRNLKSYRSRPEKKPGRA